MREQKSSDVNGSTYSSVHWSIRGSFFNYFVLCSILSLVLLLFDNCMHERIELYC